MDCDLQQLVKCLVVAVLHVRWRYTWIVIRSGCYVLLKAGRYDKEILDHLAVDLCFTCHIGEYMRSVSICWWLDVSRQVCVICCHSRHSARPHKMPSSWSSTYQLGTPTTVVCLDTSVCLDVLRFVIVNVLLLYHNLTVD